MSGRSVSFQGASDDCIEIDGCPGADEFYVNRHDFGLFKLSSEEEEAQLVVRVAYEGSNGVWSVGFMPVEEGVAVPPWPIRWGLPMNDYTACVEVVCPTDVTLERIDGEAS